MTNEWVKVELTNNTGFPRRFTVASHVAIAKGTLLKLATDRTAIVTSASGDPIAGVASMDKSATDFSTSITAWTDGIFNARTSGAIIATGDPLMSAGADNELEMADTSASGARTCAYAMEDVASGANSTINVRLRT